MFLSEILKLHGQNLRLISLSLLSERSLCTSINAKLSLLLDTNRRFSITLQLQRVL